jgi:hypothetical protein
MVTSHWGTADGKKHGLILLEPASHTRWPAKGKVDEWWGRKNAATRRKRRDGLLTWGLYQPSTQNPWAVYVLCQEEFIQMNMYSALPERSGTFFWSLEDQPRYFKSKVLVQGCKMGSKEWIWKNKSNWNYLKFIKLISFIADFQKPLIRVFNYT